MNTNYYSNYEGEFLNRIPVPRLLFTHESYRGLTIEAKVLYSLLLERLALCQEQGWYDDENRAYVYFPQQEVQDFLNVSHVKATKIMAELDGKMGLGLIERKRQGLGLPTKIYVKHFATITDTPNQSQQSSLQTIEEFHLTGG